MAWGLLKKKLPLLVGGRDRASTASSVVEEVPIVLCRLVRKWNMVD